MYWYNLTTRADEDARVLPAHLLDLLVREVSSCH
jgi:hypothetical protein